MRNLANDGSALERAAMVVIAASCTGGSCPTVYRTERDTIVVQGYALSGESSGIDLPPGEMLVEIPLDLLRSAAQSVP